MTYQNNYESNTGERGNKVRKEERAYIVLIEEREKLRILVLELEREIEDLRETIERCEENMLEIDILIEDI